MTTTVSTAIERKPSTGGALSAFRYPNFRLYFGGQLISTSGTWMQTVAQGWLVYNLTKSELWLGVVACAAGLPSLFLSPFAGVLVERLPRHKVLMVTQTFQMLLAFILAALTFGGVVQVWHVVLLSFFLGMTNAVDAPARQTLVVDLVGKEDLSSGISLSSTMYNASRVFGPSAAGIALVQFGPAWCFLINGLTFFAVLLSLFLLKIEKKKREYGAFSPLLDLRKGLAFSRFHPVIAPVLLLATVGAVFSFNVWTLLPAFADTALNSPKEGYAALSVANGIGAVVAAVLVTTLGRRLGRGRIVLLMSLFTPLMTLALSGARSLTVAIPLTVLTGFGLILQFVTMNTILQSEVDDNFRARVLSLYTVTFFGIAPFAALLLGAMAERISTSGAVAFCAVAGGVLNVIILARSPKVTAVA